MSGATILHLHNPPRHARGNLYIFAFTEHHLGLSLGPFTFSRVANFQKDTTVYPDWVL